MGMVRQIAIYLDNDTVLKKAGYRNSGDHIKRGSAAKNKKSARRDSNPRPPPWQGGAPPLSHSRIIKTYSIFKAGDGNRTHVSSLEG